MQLTGRRISRAEERTSQRKPFFGNCPGDRYEIVPADHFRARAGFLGHPINVLQNRQPVGNIAVPKRIAPVRNAGLFHFPLPGVPERIGRGPFSGNAPVLDIRGVLTQAFSKIGQDKNKARVDFTDGVGDADALVLFVYQDPPEWASPEKTDTEFMLFIT